MNCSQKRIAFGLLTLAVAASPAARADVFRDIAYGLGYAGFNIEGERNHLSDGFDFRISRNLIGTPLDYGPGELQLQGPVSLEVRTGRRGFPTLDIELQTALRSDLASQPLGYAFNFDSGSQQVDVTGTVFIDAGLSVNAFGFYDLELDYSSRQNVDQSGRYSDTFNEYDSDVGPIHVRGNIFADILALVTSPLFEATGTVNPFASFSGSAKLAQILDSSRGDDLARLASGLDVSAADPAPGSLGLQAPQHSFAADGLTTPGGTLPPTLVPEPTVLVLMLLGLPAILRRKRRLKE